MSILFYKRPDYIAKENGPMENASCQKYVDRANCSRASIPENLSYEKVMGGKTLPPCSLPDFLDYLIYIAHDAENLQFYLWFKDYSKRFEKLSKAEQALSPEWTAEESAHTATIVPNPRVSKRTIYEAALLASAEEEESTRSVPTSRRSSFDSLLAPPPPPAKTLNIAADINTQAGLKWESFSIQPLRAEVTQILAHYIQPSAPRELNLSHKIRTQVIHAIQHTTHPSAFAPILEPLLLTLRNQSHPNFIRWTICNGNKPRVFFLRSLAVTVLSIGVIMSVLLILSHQSRWWRVWVIIPFWFGTVNLVAAYKGLCVLLYRRHTRELHPWEIDTTVEKVAASHFPTGNSLVSSNDEMTNLQNPLPEPPQPTHQRVASERSATFEHDLEAQPLPAAHRMNSPASSLTGSGLNEKLLPLGARNSFEHEPWVAKWTRRSNLKKLFIKKVWVKEEGLRLIQNRIVQQAHAWGILISIPVTIGVVACPVVGVI
ncbi:hypothetical protein MMC25_002372 [Agyrium rufum]|nr:hypothetical protein [Agyrium rufum]